MRHLRKTQMGYFEHLAFAAGHGISAIVFGIGLIIHAIVPPLFDKSGRFLYLRLEEDFGDRETIEYR
jgi:hypothetical protein